MKIVITDFIDINSEAREEVEALGATVYNDTPGDEDVIIDRVKDADIITASYINITPKIIDAAERLKYIVVPAVGFEWVDSEYAKSKGIKVLNCPSHNSHAVAEHAIALLFAVARKIYTASNLLHQGQWSPQTLKGTEIFGKKLGIIGYGRIGKQVAEMASGLGMSVSFVNSSSSPEEMDEVLKASDIVCICLPLNDRTRHLVDERRLKLIQSHAVLINVGRGATLDQEALFRILQEGGIAGAGLDVFEDEPLTGNPPDSIIRLANLPNVVATPHIGYNTRETSTRLGDELIANLRSCLNSNPQNVVN